MSLSVYLSVFGSVVPWFTAQSLCSFPLPRRGSVGPLFEVTDVSASASTLMLSDAGESVVVEDGLDELLTRDSVCVCVCARGMAPVRTRKSGTRGALLVAVAHANVRDIGTPQANTNV